MSFQPHPHLQGAPALTPIPETSSTFVALPHVPLTTSPLKQLRAPPIPFGRLSTRFAKLPSQQLTTSAVPQAALKMSSSSSSLPQQITHEFYILHPTAEAIFSTNNGVRPKRQLAKPFPATVIRTNVGDDVEARATQLIEMFPEEAEKMHPLPDNPDSWYILHKYFDGHDLWIDGAKFCYYVLHAICRKCSPPS